MIGLWVAGTYLIIGLLWITLSDRALGFIAQDIHQLTWMQTVKGWLFVMLSAGLILGLTTWAVRREHRIAERVAESELRFRSTFDLAAVGMAHVGLNGRWLMVNDRLCAITGRSRSELLSMTTGDVTHPDDASLDQTAIAEMVALRNDTYTIEKRYVRPGGEGVWVLMSAQVVRDSIGMPRYFIVAVQDIEDRKRAETALQGALADKEVLLAEVHHRVRNNLQTIVSLLAIEAEKVDSAQAKKAFSDALARIQAIGLVHHQLYESREFGRIDISRYVRELCTSLASSWAPEGVRLLYSLPQYLCEPDRVIPLGMVISELVINALRHAFPDGRGTVKVTMREKRAGILELEVADDGIGLPPGFEVRRSSGLTMVRMFVDQLGGRLIHRTGQSEGTVFRMRFPCDGLQTAEQPVATISGSILP
ncbi:MAG: sensor histidine kinase [Solirubrobacterales bacterium]